MAGEPPEIGPVVDVEHDFAPGGARDADRLQLGGGAVRAREMGAAHQHRLGAFDIGRIDVALVERSIGAIVAIKDEREGLFVADAEQDERGEPHRIGADAGDVDALARATLADEAAHMLVADAGDEAASQPQTRRADGDVGRAAADRLGEGRHILQAAADLHAVEVDGRAADGDDVEAGIRHEPQLRLKARSADRPRRRRSGRSRCSSPSSAPIRRSTGRRRRAPLPSGR